MASKEAESVHLSFESKIERKRNSISPLTFSPALWKNVAARIELKFPREDLFLYGAPPPAIMRLPKTLSSKAKILVWCLRSVQMPNSVVSFAAKSL